MTTQITVHPVLLEPGESIHHEGVLELDSIEYSDLIFKLIKPISFSVDAYPSGEEDVLIHGEANAEFEVECVRCLEPAKLHVTAELEEIYYLQETTDENGDELPQIDAEGRIDIYDLLVESVIVELPFAPLHSLDCAGLCVRCGVNLNFESCTCADEPDPAHPFAGLADLIKESDKEDETSSS